MKFCPKRSLQLLTHALVLLILVASNSCKKDTSKPEEQEEIPQLNTCKAVPKAGRLNLESNEKFSFETSGGGLIEVDINKLIKITHKDYENFTIDFWGDFENTDLNIAGNHESLNGKHIKDWLGARRTLIFPDGTKLTMVTSGMHQSLVSIAIYDGEEVHCFNTNCKILEYSAAKSAFRQALDDREADGETSTFEISETGLILKTIYTEDLPGNKQPGEYELGELSRENPRQVHDYFDDPRLGHT